MSCSSREAYDNAMEEFHDQFYRGAALDYYQDFDYEVDYMAWLHEQAKQEAEVLRASVPVTPEVGSRRL